MADYSRTGLAPRDAATSAPSHENLVQTGMTALSVAAAQRPQGFLGEIAYFARRRPGAFLAAATAAGFVIGRLGKAVTYRRKGVKGP